MMKGYEVYGNRASTYGEAEPLDIGFMIDRNWQRCWPRIIARAWTYQLSEADKASQDSNYQNKVDLMNSGAELKVTSPDDQWYKDLLSHDPVLTKQALEHEGMAFMASNNAEKEDWSKWIFTKIVVKTREQSFEQQLQSLSYEEQQGSPQNLGHFLVLTLPPLPTDKALIAQALADYKATNKIYPLS